MGETEIYLMLVAEILFLALFFYVLYLIGGISQNTKKILHKIEEIETKLGAH